MDITEVCRAVRRIVMEVQSEFRKAYELKPHTTVVVRYSHSGSLTIVVSDGGIAGVTMAERNDVRRTSDVIPKESRNDEQSSSAAIGSKNQQRYVSSEVSFAIEQQTLETIIELHRQVWDRVFPYYVEHFSDRAAIEIATNYISCYIRPTDMLCSDNPVEREIAKIVAEIKGELFQEEDELQMVVDIDQYFEAKGEILS